MWARVLLEMRSTHLPRFNQRMQIRKTSVLRPWVRLISLVNHPAASSGSAQISVSRGVCYMYRHVCVDTKRIPTLLISLQKLHVMQHLSLSFFCLCSQGWSCCTSQKWCGSTFLFSPAVTTTTPWRRPRERCRTSLLDTGLWVNGIVILSPQTGCDLNLLAHH